jgi:two-component system nitrate/nitrite response regulator NarL
LVIIFSTEPDILQRWQKFLPQSIGASSTEKFESLLADTPDAILLLHTRGLSDPYSTIAWLLEKHPLLQLFVLEDLPSFPSGSKLLPLGIRGYGNAVMSEANLLQAIAVIRNGNIWLYPDFMTALIASLHTPQEKKTAGHFLKSLTPTEQQIASLVSEGLSNKEIATRQDVTERTVKAHLGSIYRKLDVSGRFALALLFK